MTLKRLVLHSIAFAILLSTFRLHAEDTDTWLTQHSAGYTVNQTQEEALYYPGTITVGDETVSLGEDPPMIHYQLKSKFGGLLLGEFDDRNNYCRFLGTVRMVDGMPQVDAAKASIKYSSFASCGGFVFQRNENEISRVGIIIPDIQVPEGVDPVSPDVHIGTYILNDEALAKIVPQALGADVVVVMPSGSAIPETARVLWLSINADGTFSVPLTADQTWQGYAQNGAAATQVPRLITDQAKLAEVWSTCERTDSCPDIDFINKFVYAATAKATHVSINSVILENGDLKIQLVDTADTPPGFSYVLGVFSREGVTSVNGAALPK